MTRPPRPAAPAIIISPSTAAARLNLPIRELVAMIRRQRYPFTALKVDGKPGDRGRNRWGLTEEQYATIVRGQARAFPPPEPTRPGAHEPASPDGVSRLRTLRHPQGTKPRHG